MRIGSPSAVFHPATDHVVFGNLSFNLSLSLSALVSSSVKLRHCCLVLPFLFWNFLESFKKVSTGLEKNSNPKQQKAQTKRINKTPLTSHTKHLCLQCTCSLAGATENFGFLSAPTQAVHKINTHNHLPSNPNQ